MNSKLSLSLAALTAVALFTIYSAPAFAAAATTPPRGDTPPGGGAPCTVDCGGGGGEIDEPGEPFNPPGGGDDGDDGGDNPKDDPKDDPIDEPGEPGEPGGDPNYPSLTKAELSELKRCIANLDKLPTVSETQVNQFGQPYKVSLTPVCDTQFKSAVEATGALVEGGNANGLETAIRRNEAMTGKLGQTQYKPSDVVGIDFDAKGNAILFVHKKRG